MRTSYAAGHPQVTLARRLPRHPQGGPLHGVPARRVQRDDGLARRERRAGRDLERHAVLLAGVGARGRTVAWLHHVHDTMWEMTLPPRLARVGRTIEFRVAPPLYRRTPIVTLSDSSKRELVDELALHGRTGSTSCRPVSTRGSRPGGDEVADAARRRGRPARAGEAVRRCSSTRSRRAKPRHPAAAGGHRRRGLRARGARGAGPRGRRRADWIESARVASTTTSSSTCTGGRGCCPRARRRARAGG